MVAAIKSFTVVNACIFMHCAGGAPARHDNKESETFLKDSQTQETNPNKGGNPPDEKISLAASAKENERQEH
ncbi:hypothetical protein C0J52_25355 [Blattella germanica]|nr:hypothetical protein C0J52_25355 [Blattella germanica]